MTAAVAMIDPPGVRRIIGPTILMGDGSYYDYEDPDSSQMTIEDYAWGLAGKTRFSSQTRARLLGGRRCLYSVAQHCVLMARHLIADGHGFKHAYAGLMHEGGEVVWGDLPGPAKILVPEFKAREKRAERASFARWGVEMTDPALIKRYDLRMLATEKRDLMPQGAADEWANAEDAVGQVINEPFILPITPWPLEESASIFITEWEQLYELALT
jgi:hypothetical protein